MSLETYNSQYSQDINTDKFVNGPINAARLEGTVSGVHKVLYTFMDYHAPVTKQTQCDDYNSIELVRYVVTMLRQADKTKTYDIFAEIYKTTLTMPEYPLQTYQY